MGSFYKLLRLFRWERMQECGPHKPLGGEELEVGGARKVYP